MKIYVDYEVEGFGQRSAGPYESWEEATSQRQDIEGFEGVSNVKLRQDYGEVKS